MSEVVQKQVQDGVAMLTLNRPERLNAWTTEMEHDYFGMLEECARLGRGSRDRRHRRGPRLLRGRRHAGAAGARRGRRHADRAGPRAAAADVPAVDPQADHRRDQRRLRRDRPRAGADVRHPLRRRGRQADDGVRPPRARRRARHLVDPAPPHRSRAGARPAALGARRARPRRRASSASSTACSRPRGCSRTTLAYARELAVNCSPASMATIKRQVYADLAARAARTRSPRPTG